MTDLYWDPYDTAIDAKPYDVWRRLRDEAPVYYNEQYDFYALSRYEDVQAASRDTKGFSSNHGIVLELMTPKPWGSHAMLILLDPPDHTQVRSLVSRAFTPRRMGALQDDVRTICAELLDPHMGSGSFDYVQDFAAILPSRVISSLLGVPETDRPHVRELIDTMFHIEPGVGMVNDISFNAGLELNQYLRDAMEERRKSPRDDMLTDLVQAEITDETGTLRQLTIREAADFGNLLVSAGTETVARLLGWAAIVLDENPDQRAELAADASLIPNAVEELLRYEAPSPVQGRWTKKSYEMHGTTIPQDSKVLLLTGSAGRDERTYEDPDTFDIHRSFDQHVSFGYGVHFCIGAALARMEGRVGLEETFKRFPEWSVDTERSNRLHTSTVRGWINVQIDLPPARAAESGGPARAAESGDPARAAESGKA